MINAFWGYAACLFVFAAGAVLLNALGRRSGAAAVTAAVPLSILAFTLLWALSNPHGDDLFADYVRAYYAAGEAALAGPAELGMLLKANYFVNLPVLAWLFAPLALLKPASLSAFVFMGLGLAASYAAWRMLCQAADLGRAGAVLLAFLFAANGPFCYNLKEGNTSQIVLALLAGAFLFVRREKEFTAGLLLGAAFLLKLPLFLFAVYFAARGRWRVFAGMSAVTGGAALLSLLLLGWPVHEQWFAACVAPFLKDPMAAYNVQSVYGFLARLEFGDRYLMDWNPHPLPSPYPWVMKAAAFVTYAVSALAMARAPKNRAPREIEFLIVLVLALVASPMSWSHYYLWLLFPAAFFIGRGWPMDRMTGALGWASLALASLPVMLPYTRHAWAMEAFVRFFLSHFLWSGFLMLALLLRVRWKLGAAER